MNSKPPASRHYKGLILSIITPVLNGAPYLRTFIQNVIDQRCPHTEHIIVDGGSQDNSVTIIEEFAREYPHIRWLSEKDSGSAEAINKGIALARGAFITILCLNDFYEPDTLNEVVTLLPVLLQPAFLVGNCNMLNEKDELLYVNRPEALTPLRVMMKKQFPYNPSAYFYYKGLHEKAGLYHNCNFFDVDFLLRVFPAAKIRYEDKCWGNFRMLPDSITVKARKAGKLDLWQDEIFERHLKAYPVWRRIFFRAAIAVNKKCPRLVYYWGRGLHYFGEPKDVLRYLRKNLGSKSDSY